MSESPFIIDVTRENYSQLIEASFKVPVLLDFWASWCQPCQVLMPILARLAEEYGGKFLLGKLNTEEEQEIAAQFAIRGIPTVKLFRDGQPVDEFTGALPEKAIRDFLDRHVAHESDATVLEAEKRLRTGDAEGAVELLKEASAQSPDDPRLILTLATAQAAAGDIGGAEATLDGLPAGERDNPEVAALQSRLFFAGRVTEAPAATELEDKLAKDPKDVATLYQLAMRKVVDEHYEEAMELLLQLIQTDRSFGDDAGRSALLKVFELLGEDPLVGQYRRRMASLLH